MTEDNNLLLLAEREPADISMLSEAQVGTYTRAFIRDKADFIIVDGWSLRRSPWQAEDLAQMEPLGLLVHDPGASKRASDEQYTAVCYRPSRGFLAALRALAKGGSDVR